MFDFFFFFPYWNTKVIWLTEKALVSFLLSLSTSWAPVTALALQEQKTDKVNGESRVLASLLHLYFMQVPTGWMIESRMGRASWNCKKGFFFFFKAQKESGWFKQNTYALLYYLMKHSRGFCGKENYRMYLFDSSEINLTLLRALGHWCRSNIDINRSLIYFKIHRPPELLAQKLYDIKKKKKNKTC